MRSCLILLIVFFISFNSSANALSDWPKDAQYPKIVRKASADESPLIVYFYTDWCSYCKRLNKEYLSTKNFKELSLELHKIQINPEKSSKAHSLFKSKYRGTGYPTIIVSVPGISEEFLQLQPFLKQGNLSPSEYVKELRAMIAQIYTKTAFKLFNIKKYKQARKYLYKSLTFNKNDKNALTLIAVTYHEEGVEKQNNTLLEKAKTVYEKALSIYPNDPDLLKNLKLLTGQA